MNRLRQIRQAKKLTAAELGRRIKVDPSVVRHVELGDAYAYPSFRRRVARILGVREEKIFGRHKAE
jgi:transcriptional regulator with XRE-family HTH domain